METEIIAEPDKQEIFFRRHFNVPRDLLFYVYTNPDLYIQWIGPHERASTIERPDSKNGGKWRYTQKDDKGNEYVVNGVNHETVAPDPFNPLSPARIISTFEIESLGAGHVALETVIFESLSEDKAKVVDQSVFQSVADRDAVIKSGIGERVTASFNRLDVLLAKELIKIKVGKSFKNMFLKLFRL